MSEDGGELNEPTQLLLQDVNDTELLDKIMTGWDPIRPTAGQKRSDSHEIKIIRPRSLREFKRYDYKRIHHGKSAISSTDPKKWSDAMISSKARQWKEAADRECQSLQDNGAIEIIPRKELSSARKTMKCKWFFKKKLNIDGNLERFKPDAQRKDIHNEKGSTIMKLSRQHQDQKMEEFCYFSHINLAGTENNVISQLHSLIPILKSTCM